MDFTIQLIIYFLNNYSYHYILLIMPTNTKRYYRKKRTYRRKRHVRVKGSMSRAVSATQRQPFPNTYYAKLHYVTTVNLDPVLGAPGQHLFRANSLYDPDLTAVGHQPRGFDELSALYQKYLVVGSKISVTFSGNADTTSASYVCGIALRDLSSPLSVFADYAENGNCKWHVGDPGVSNFPIMTMGYSPKKYHGLANIKDDGAYGGLTGNIGTGSDPAKGAQWHVWAAPADNITEYTGIQAIVTLEYSALFTDPKKLVQS